MFQIFWQFWLLHKLSIKNNIVNSKIEKNQISLSNEMLQDKVVRTFHQERNTDMDFALCQWWKIDCQQLLETHQLICTFLSTDTRQCCMYVLTSRNVALDFTCQWWKIGYQVLLEKHQCWYFVIEKIILINERSRNLTLAKISHPSSKIDCQQLLGSHQMIRCCLIQDSRMNVPGTHLSMMEVEDILSADIGNPSVNDYLTTLFSCIFMRLHATIY